MNKWDTRKLKTYKKNDKKSSLQMLTCYDYQNAQMLSETNLDLILVGDSLGNVILGFDTTIPVTIEHMKFLSAAVKRGAPNIFTIADLPFGSYSSVEKGIENAIDLFQSTGVEAIKLEGAHQENIELIRRLTQIGIPVMGHIGLTPQSVHQMGGYYTHGKNQNSANNLLAEAQALEKAGIFSLVLECVVPEVATEITQALSIPTIGIGSGTETDGQVLVLNDLLGMGKSEYPKFVKPIENLYQLKKDTITKYLNEQK